VISSGKATLAELKTIYGLEDLWDMIEVLLVDAHNERAIAKHQEKKS
jgi:hypothetical protein